MAVNKELYLELSSSLKKSGIVLVAVSKTKPVADILELYAAGQRDFGENYVQELLEKQAVLPADINWHFIGHLQSNKVKSIAPFVHLIHGVDSLKLLKEINRQAGQSNRIISCLLQVHIAKEETKFGFGADEILSVFNTLLENAEDYHSVQVTGLMGMASLSDEPALVAEEFQSLRQLFDQCRMKTGNRNKLTILSMGMSGDYLLAAKAGTTMVRIGSLLFGERN